MLKIQITKKKLLISLLFLLILTAVYYTGGVIGFFTGDDSAMYFRDSDAYTTTLALSKLRNNDIRGAINLLETRLDLEIIQKDGARDSFHSPFNIFQFLFYDNPEKARRYLLSFVAEYRDQYPSTNILPEVRKKINDILARTDNRANK
jgi:hypothetical protein